jgi:hypothetical protein
VSTFKGQAAIFALWFLPGWIVRWMPRSFIEAVEREVYDGLTRHEWFEARVRELHEANAKTAGQKGSEAPR